LLKRWLVPVEDEAISLLSNEPCC
jgi:hypothetical protein